MMGVLKYAPLTKKVYANPEFMRPPTNEAIN